MSACRTTVFLGLALVAAGCGGAFTSDSLGIDAGSAGSAGTGGSTGAMGGSTSAGGSAGAGGVLSAGGAAGAGGVTGTGGAAGSGGKAGAAGAGGKGGAAGAGGAVVDAGACVNSTVTFQLKAASGSWCLGQGCSTVWLAMRDAAGHAMTLSNYCQPSCDECVMVGCPAICALPQPMPASGATTTWNGTYFVSNVCGPTAMSCLAKRCAPAGRYVAVMCATGVSADAGDLACASASDTPQTCIEVPFEYPTATPVVGVIPIR